MQGLIEILDVEILTYSYPTSPPSTTFVFFSVERTTSFKLLPDYKVEISSWVVVCASCAQRSGCLSCINDLILCVNAINRLFAFIGAVRLVIYIVALCFVFVILLFFFFSLQARRSGDRDSKQDRSRDETDIQASRHKDTKTHRDAQRGRDTAAKRPADVETLRYGETKV